MYHECSLCVLEMRCCLDRWLLFLVVVVVMGDEDIPQL